MSLRSSNIEIPPILKKALEKTNGGYGGGHPNACGGCVKKSDFEDFLNDIREQIKDE